LVIFGASGDLTHRKIAPALYRLRKEQSSAAQLFPCSEPREPR
jgi:glucose-6-phosphate 1-dehydrogenase